MGRGRGVRGKVKEGVACIMGEVGTFVTCDMDGMGSVSSVSSRGCSNTGVACWRGAEGCSGDEGRSGEGAL